MAAGAEREPNLDRSIETALKAYCDGNPLFFDFLSDDVRVYNLDSSEPTIGRKAFEEQFGDSLTRTAREVRKTHEDLRVSGNQAIQSQTLQITVEGVTLPVRQTVVWEDKGEDWRMTHIHNARAGQAYAIGRQPETAEGIRVLNERIATVAAVVGVAQ